MPEGQDLEISRPWPVSVLAPLLTGKSLREIVVFLIVGVSNTILTFLVYLLLLRVAHYAAAYTGAFVVGLVFTGLLNIRVTFLHHPTVAACIAFSVYYGLYYLFTLALLHALVAWLGIAESYALMVLLPIVVPINFVITKLIAHRFGRAVS